MAEFQDSQRVVQVTKSLATYFRLALNQGKDLICLSDEINHVRQYLFIQKQRYGDKLEYEIDENPAFDNLVLPVGVTTSGGKCSLPWHQGEGRSGTY